MRNEIMRKKISELEEQAAKETNLEKLEKLGRSIMALEKCETERKEQEELEVRMNTELKSAKNNLKIQTIGLIVTSVLGVLGFGVSAWAASETVKTRRNEIKARTDYKV